MSFYAGKDSTGRPILHITRDDYTEDELKSQKFADTLFHSDLPYIRATGVFEFYPYKVSTAYYDLAPPQEVQDAIAAGQMYVLSGTGGNRYNTYPYYAVENSIVRVPASTISHTHRIGITGGDFALEAENSSYPTSLSTSLSLGAGGSIEGFSSKIPEATVTYTATSTLAHAHAAAAGYQGGAMLLADTYDSTYFPSNIIWDPHMQGFNNSGVSKRLAAVRGMVTLLNLRVVNGAIQTIPVEDLDDNGILITNEDITVGSNFKLTEGYLLANIGVGGPKGVVPPKMGTSMATDSSYNNTEEFKHFNTLYGNFTSALVPGSSTYNMFKYPQLHSGTVQHYNSFQDPAWYLEDLYLGTSKGLLYPSTLTKSYGVMYTTFLEPKSFLQTNNPGIELTANTLSYTSDTDKLDIVSDGASLLMLSDDEVTISIPSSTHYQSSIQSGASLIDTGKTYPSGVRAGMNASNYYSPGNLTERYYSKTTLVSRTKFLSPEADSRSCMFFLDVLANGDTILQYNGGTYRGRSTVSLSDRHRAAFAPFTFPAEYGLYDNVLLYPALEIYKGSFWVGQYQGDYQGYYQNLEIVYTLRVNWGNKSLDIYREEKLELPNHNWDSGIAARWARPLNGNVAIVTLPQLQVKLKTILSYTSEVNP